MNFLSYDHSFCEASIYGGPPEYINAFTSLFISYIGYYGMKNNFHYNTDIFLLYSALLINGFASFAYHWTNYIGFGLFDRCSMILIAYPAINGGMKEIKHLYNLNNSTNIYLLFFTQLYFSLLMTFCALGYEELFNGFFGIFLGLILIFIILINNKKQIINKKIHKYISLGKIGIGMITIAGVSWIIIEKLCNTYSIMKYLQGHALWHIFVSLGGYLASLLLTALYMDRKQILHFYNFNMLTISYFDKYN